ncbi:Cation efflux protein [gamma proteobacterium HdN1]|nr:Cation efflux protein [gamma proteobacterium HdN1]
MSGPVHRSHSEHKHCEHADHDHSGHDHSGHSHAGHDHSGHDHSGHDHAGHSHVQAVTEDNERRIRFVFFFTAGYAIIQAVGGWLSGSLALIADSGHMISDSAALLLALMAYRIAKRPADGTRTYGFARVRVLAALANGLALFLLVLWIAWEAIGRIAKPVEVLAGPMLIVATVGMLVNLIGAWILWRGNKGDSNLHGTFLHVVGDLLGSVGAIAAAIGIMFTGWTLLDPILSVLVALLVVRSAWTLIKGAMRVLLQATPQGVNAIEAEKMLAALPEIAEAGHFHAWVLADSSTVATVHVSPADGIDPMILPELVARQLREHHQLDHVTVQVDPRGFLKRIQH